MFLETDLLSLNAFKLEENGNRTFPLCFIAKLSMYNQDSAINKSFTNNKMSKYKNT